MADIGVLGDGSGGISKRSGISRTRNRIEVVSGVGIEAGVAMGVGAVAVIVVVVVIAVVVVVVVE